MSTDDRFLPQGKQILPKICQVRPMPISELIIRARDEGCSVVQSKEQTAHQPMKSFTHYFLSYAN